ncbi:MAG: hypothetical protein ACAH95_05785 [Fimbriimonas sp.]
MEVVRYKAGEAIRWLQTGAENIRRGAKAKGKSVIDPNGGTFGHNLKTAAGAIVDYGKGTYADLMHKQAEANEYVLLENHFDIVRGSAIKTVEYERVKKIEVKGDRASITLDKGNLTIKPFAHVVAGRAKVPVGWSRNGIEVPFELLIEELSARCGIDVDEEN